MSKLELLRAFYEYNEYANNRLLESASKLSEADFSRELTVSFGSIEGNLAHIVAGQVVWLERWRTGSNSRSLEEAQALRGLDAVREAFNRSHLDLNEFMNGLTDERLNSVLAYTDSRGDPYKRELWKLVLHVGNHGSYHRGETAIALTGIGHNPGNLDYSYFELAREARNAG
jgi:uncharacterized damage-inducible protein DinB